MWPQQPKPMEWSLFEERSSLRLSGGWGGQGSRRGGEGSAMIGEGGEEVEGGEKVEMKPFGVVVSTSIAI